MLLILHRLMHFHYEGAGLEVGAPLRKFHQNIALTLYMFNLFTFIYFFLLNYLESIVLVGALFLDKFHNSKVTLTECIYDIKVINVIRFRIL